MTILFLSDMHLHNACIQNKVIACIEMHKPYLKQLYLLGDIFNVWIGDEQRLEEHLQPFMHCIKGLKKLNIDVFIMHGNRDFLMGSVLCAYLNCVLLPDPYILHYSGKKFLLTHGDILCTNDVAYQRLRRILRNKYVQWFFLKLPYSYRQNIAMYIRKKSKGKINYTKKTLNAKYDINMNGLENWYHRYAFDIVIHGHTHQSYHYYTKDYQRIVLSDWHKHGGTYAIIQAENIENINIELKTYYE